MSFKNAIKILVSKFGLVWIMLLYAIIFGVVICSLSAVFVIPAIRNFIDEGIFTEVRDLFGGVFNGQSLTSWFISLREILRHLSQLLMINTETMIKSTIFIVMVLGVAFRFLLGLYEIPLITVIEGHMSSNAKLNYFNTFIGNLKLSFRYSFFKMLFAMLYDVLMVFVFAGLFRLLDINTLNLFAPFFIMLAFIILFSFRFSLLSMWAPSIVLGNRGVLAGFRFSLKRIFSFFGSVYSSFIVGLITIVAINLLVGLFTLGVGLLVTAPLSMVFVNILNMTLYYGKNNRRYYIDERIYTPPLFKE